jgi:hypothetical protein
MQPRKFLKWTGGSLIGHVVFFELIFSLPLLVVFLYLNYLQHTLTVDWAIHMVLISPIPGAVLAVLIWYTITLPRIRRHGDRR